MGADGGGNLRYVRRRGLENYRTPFAGQHLRARQKGAHQRRRYFLGSHISGGIVVVNLAAAVGPSLRDEKRVISTRAEKAPAPADQLGDPDHLFGLASDVCSLGRRNFDSNLSQRTWCRCGQSSSQIIRICV